jgi:hypothetical protein
LGILFPSINSFRYIFYHLWNFIYTITYFSNGFVPNPDISGHNLQYFSNTHFGTTGHSKFCLPFRFSSKILCAFLISPIQTIHLSHSTRLDHNIIGLSDE